MQYNGVFLVNKTNRCTEFQPYWYYYSTCFGQPFCPSSGVLSRTSALVHFMQMWRPFANRSRMAVCATLLLAQNSWWWAERLPDTCRVVIPIKLEFNASVGFIHKEDANHYRLFRTDVCWSFHRSLGQTIFLLPIGIYSYANLGMCAPSILNICYAHLRLQPTVT